MSLINVSRPIFHLHQPGEDDTYTTRGQGPQQTAIKTRKDRLANELSQMDGSARTPQIEEDSPIEPDELEDTRYVDDTTRQDLPENEKNTDLFIGEALTNDALDLADKNDIHDYVRGKITPDLIQKMKETLVGVKPIFGQGNMIQDPSNRKDGELYDDEFYGDEITPQDVDMYFKRRGY